MIKLIEPLKDLCISGVVGHNPLISIFRKSPVKSSATPWQEIPEDGPSQFSRNSVNSLFSRSP